jgi:hypothetical protein
MLMMLATAMRDGGGCSGQLPKSVSCMGAKAAVRLQGGGCNERVLGAVLGVWVLLAATRARLPAADGQRREARGVVQSLGARASRAV